MKEAFNVKVYDIEQGRNEVVLSAKQARRMGVDVSGRVELSVGKKKTTAIVNLAHRTVSNHEIGVFWEAVQELKLKNGQKISVSPLRPPASLDAIRRKLDGKTLEPVEVRSIITDLMNGHLATPELAAFIAAVHTRDMTIEETTALTEAIYQSGERLTFKKTKPVLSEHSIGGVAGDRTSMLFVPIMASLDVLVPKTCSRAISSAAGTADVMELFCPVDLTAQKMKAVVEKTNGCLVWGGAVNMAAADDKLIQIRHPLHLDPHPLLLSSILAKKKAEGAKYVILDIPTGIGAKVREVEEARALAKKFRTLGEHLEINVEVTITDGSEPLMPFAGPALEAKEALRTMEGSGWNGLAEKSCQLSGVAIALLRGVSREEGYRLARHRLKDGHALQKFLEIVAAQGGKKEPQSADVQVGKFRATVFAPEEGTVEHVDNRRLSRVARALGAPDDKLGGLHVLAMKGDRVEKGQPICELYASSQDKLDYGLEQIKHFNPVDIEKIVIDVV
ncbi:thymidine phosphorylase [Candidatus Micrarchaeota archaeon]|nr:thymidine phosphorylase [Candidatus Micrarchaeota archaeon]